MRQLTLARAAKPRTSPARLPMWRVASRGLEIYDAAIDDEVVAALEALTPVLDASDLPADHAIAARLWRPD